MQTSEQKELSEKLTELIVTKIGNHILKVLSPEEKINFIKAIEENNETIVSDLLSTQEQEIQELIQKEVSSLKQ